MQWIWPSSCSVAKSHLVFWITLNEVKTRCFSVLGNYSIQTLCMYLFVELVFESCFNIIIFNNSLNLSITRCFFFLHRKIIFCTKVFFEKLLRIHWVYFIFNSLNFSKSVFSKNHTTNVLSHFFNKLIIFCTFGLKKKNLIILLEKFVTKDSITLLCLNFIMLVF